MNGVSCMLLNVIARKAFPPVQKPWQRFFSDATNGPFNYLNGSRVHPEKASETRPIIEPATGMVIAELPLSDVRDVHQAVSNSGSAFRTWSQTSVGERCDILCRTAELIKKNADDIARIEVQDCGKPIWEARFDILACADCLTYFGRLAQGYSTLGQQLPLTKDAFLYTRREPLGICVGIGAWNFPFLVASWKAAPALASGNTFVYKPSEHTPLTAVILAECFSEAGLPPGCFNVVQGESKTGHYLCVHPDVAKVSFTGSVPTGAKVMAACSDGIKRVTLELGGKSPLIIFDDCHLDNAVKGALLANFLSQGQVCSNAARVFVQKSILPVFIDKFVSATKALRIGNPYDDDTQVGATINVEHASKVLSFVTEAEKEGAIKLCGGERVQLNDSKLAGGYYLSPCILSNLNDDMHVVREEIFGAVACILEFDSEAEVVKRANNTDFGLAGGVFTLNLARGHRMAAALEAGTIWINNYNIYPPDIAFGGYKKSGIGRENGTAVLEHYTQLKSVYVELGNVDCPLLNE